MSEIWLAVRFSDRGSGDGADIYGAYDSREEAVGVLEEEFEEWENDYVIDIEPECSTFRFKKGQFNWLGQAMKFEVGKKTSVNV